MNLRINVSAFDTYIKTTRTFCQEGLKYFNSLYEFLIIKEFFLYFLGKTNENESRKGVAERLREFNATSEGKFYNKSQIRPSVAAIGVDKEAKINSKEGDKTAINFSSGHVIDDPKLELSAKPNSTTTDKIDLQGHLTSTQIYDQTSNAFNVPASTAAPGTSSKSTNIYDTVILGSTTPTVTTVLQDSTVVSRINELLNLTTAFPDKQLTTKFDQVLESPPTTTTISSVSSGVQVNSSDTIWPVKHAAVVEGELVLGGLMMVHEREDFVTCGPIMPQGGIQALEAMLYTLDRINSDPTILPNITLGAHILDDCDKDTYGLEMAVDFIKGTYQIPNIRKKFWHKPCQLINCKMMSRVIKILIIITPS